jgi:hypothetical protein
MRTGMTRDDLWNAAQLLLVGWYTDEGVTNNGVTTET